MPRPPRSAIGNTVYHVLNRANGRMTIFRTSADYEAFVKIIGEACRCFPMRILAYCLMPNHWHLALYPRGDNDLPPFMRWVTLTHTQRWHARHRSMGYGHLYQGRYKSFPVQRDAHFLQVMRYIERNAKRAALVRRAEDWRWSSAHTRALGTAEQRNLLSAWPVEPGSDYLNWVNAPQPKEAIEDIRYAAKRGRPYGDDRWVSQTVTRLRLESTMRDRGRPRKGT